MKDLLFASKESLETRDHSHSSVSLNNKIGQVYCGLSIIKGKMEGEQTIGFFVF